ncbi:MAG: zinc ribbon domain-containing protein [Chthoniobacterales bacterium]
MLQEIEILLRLQDKDQHLANLQTDLAAIPKERQVREKQLADSAEKLEFSKSRSKELKVQQNEIEVEVEAKQNQIARYKTQQMETRKNDEFQALAHEITSAEKQISELETKELEIMEESDSLIPKIQKAEALHEEEKIKIGNQLTQLEEKKGHLAKQIENYQAESDALAAQVEENLLVIYRRLFETKNGNPVVALEENVCSGCHVKVPTQIVIAVKNSKEITGCPQCGRLLYMAR